MTAYFPTVVALFAFYIALPIFTHTMYWKAMLYSKIFNGVVCENWPKNTKKKFVTSYKLDMCVLKPQLKGKSLFKEIINRFFFTLFLLLLYSKLIIYLFSLVTTPCTVITLCGCYCFPSYQNLECFMWFPKQEKRFELQNSTKVFWFYLISWQWRFSWSTCHIRIQYLWS